MRKFLPIVTMILLAGLAAAQQPQGFSLQIIHSSDNESAFQDPNTLEERIIGYAAVVSGLRALAPDGNSLFVTAGDHTLPGPFYEASAEVPSLGAPGIGDIEIFNAMGLAANGIGNHEFDGGINDFARMLARADYPFIAVNLDFSKVQLEPGVPPIQAGVDGGSVAANAGRVVRSAYATIGGERIGLIGRAPASFFEVIEDPDENLPGLDFVGGRNRESNQPLVSAVGQVLEQVALLQAQGIDKIILLDHAQDFTADPLSASSLSGIDVIVSAGATGFMAGSEANGPFNLLRDGDSAVIDYPTLRLDRDGRLVAVVNTEQLYRYVGHLLVEFDAAGHITAIDHRRSGQIATDSRGQDALGQLSGGAAMAPPAVSTLFNELQSTPTIRNAFGVIGETESPLNGTRADVRSRETNLGRLAADSTLWFTRLHYPQTPADVALKNGGGIRANILGPQMTQLTVDTALAFNNKISGTVLTASELLAVMENAVSRAPARDGRFPQLAGAELHFDISYPGVSDQVSVTVPSRVRELIVHRANGVRDVVVQNGALRGDAERTFILVTNSFLMTGGDGYRGLSDAAERHGAVTTTVGERQVLVDYIQNALGGRVQLADPPSDPRIVLVGTP